MSKKKRRKKNNKAKRDFNKNVFFKEKVEARREVEMTDEFLFEDENNNSSKKIDSSMENEKPQYDKDERSGVINEYFQRILSLFDNYLKNSKITLKKWNNIFCARMTCKTNLKRDIVIIVVAIVLSISFILWDRYLNSTQNKKLNEDEKVLASFDEPVILDEEENITEIKMIQDRLTAEDWKEYRSNWYGFKIKYPKEWRDPKIVSLNRGSKETFRISFLAAENNEKYKGFDVVIYDISKAKDLFATNEFPKIKNEELVNSEYCQNIEGHLIETGDYPAEEIYISIEDDCYNPTLFFSLVDGQYIYNMVPIFKEGVSGEVDPLILATDYLPEFFVAVSQFENIDIVRPKPKPIQPKISAPQPASYKVVNGRKVCAKKNDKPGKSDKNKKKHLDMECCLDPDEYPNPNCYYDPGKYGKYMK